jgi:hypothetical protein
MASTTAAVSLSPLQTILKETEEAFVAAKADGKLEATEVVQIALQISKKIHLLSGLSLADKKALILLALKKGMVSAQGLHGMAELVGSGPDGVAAAERQILNGAMAAVDGLMSHVPQLFAPVKNALLACLPFLSQAANVASQLLPQDAALIHEAFECVASVAGKAPVPAAVVSTLESVETVVAAVPVVPAVPAVPAPVEAAAVVPAVPSLVEAAAVVAPVEVPAAPVEVPAVPAPVPGTVEDTPPQSTPETAPNPEASLPSVPEQVPEAESVPPPE